jgi:chromosomal replication initiator protein
LELPAHLEPSSAWREIRVELRRMVGESTYDIWLDPIEVKALDGAVLLLQAPPATQAWVAKRFGHILETCARTVVGAGISVSFVGTGARPGSGPGERGAPSSRGDHIDVETELTEFNPRYSFNQFIIGDGNRLAHAAALTVAELPGQAYNPLFLHAPPGLGKTHLLHAIGNYVVAFGGGATVRYTTVEAFTNHFISALGSRSVDRFKRAYRDADVLLIDDVQFLASKVKTEEEFFHTFNALYETGRQLVLTCDRLPRQLTSVEERLRERFESGLVADIRPPDFATRVAILRKRTILDGITLADSAVLDLIAERVPDNVRALEGALIRIVAHHSLTGRPIDLSLAQSVLDQIHPAPAGSGRRNRAGTSLTLEQIQQVTAAYYDLTLDELLSTSRAARVAWPRQVALHLARELTTASLNQIGTGFHRNHATVLHACKRVSDRVAHDQQAADEIQHLATTIRGEQPDRTY